MRAVACALIPLLAAPTARAESPNRSPYEVDWGLDGALILGLGAAAFTIPSAFERSFDSPPCGACDAREVNPMDRPVTGNWSTGAAAASDVLLIATASLPFLIDFVEVMADSESDGFEGFAKDAVVMAEALTVNFALTNLFKVAVERPRPFTYNPAAPLEEKLEYDAAQSFFSGHASTTFCAAAAFSVTFHRRHPESPWRFVVWIGSFSMAATTALLRERAGKHYWTDLLAGAAVGTLVGLVVPWLHFEHHDAVRGVDLSITPLGVTGAF